MPADFAHLRLHTEYSLIDSVVRVPELVDAVDHFGTLSVVASGAVVRKQQASKRA